MSQTARVAHGILTFLGLLAQIVGTVIAVVEFIG
jgi:hypothetical protein